MRCVASVNSDFQKIFLDIRDTSLAEQLDRYTRGLKPYIWKELCALDYGNLTGAMGDSKHIKAARRRIRITKPNKMKTPRAGAEGGRNQWISVIYN